VRACNHTLATMWRERQRPKRRTRALRAMPDDVIAPRLECMRLATAFASRPRAGRAHTRLLLLNPPRGERQARSPGRGSACSFPRAGPGRVAGVAPRRRAAAPRGRSRRQAQQGAHPRQPTRAWRPPPRRLGRPMQLPWLRGMMPAGAPLPPCRVARAACRGAGAARVCAGRSAARFRLPAAACVNSARAAPPAFAGLIR